MEIIVHGTKGGYKVLYQTQNVPFSIARDVRRSDRNDGNPVGESAYSIAFAEKGFSFSKYIIVRDIERAAVGNIAFSVFIPNNKKLEGKDIIMLLDELSGKYYHDYIEEGNLGNKTEDWTFVNALSSQFKDKYFPDPSDYEENIQQGKEEAAYIFYSTSEDLQKYFDAPFQKEYSSLKQVFFVKSDLQDNLKNPLNALRHDSDKNLTGKIDLENKSYKLKQFNGLGKNDVTIEIWANDRRRINKDSIYTKDNIRIRYSKGKYFIPVDESGRLTDDKMRQYLEIDENNRIITIIDLVLKPIIKTIFITINEIINGQIIPITEIGRTDIIFKISSNSSQYIVKSVVNNEIKFEAEEQKYLWTVSASSGNFISKPIIFTPESYNENLVINLEEHKTVLFTVTDSELVNDYNIQIKDKQGKSIKCDKEIIFIGEQIYKIYDVTIYSYKHENKNFEYCPATDENPYYVNLIKKPFASQRENRSFYIDAESNGGKKLRNCPGFSISESGNDIPNNSIKPPENYIFVKWYLDKGNKNKNYDGTLVAIYEKKKIGFLKKITKKDIIAIVLLFLFVIILFFTVNYFIILKENGTDNTKNKNESFNSITLYLNGIELNWDSLMHFKSELKKTENDSDDNKSINSELANAIAIREAIDSGKLDDLINKKYNKSQEILKLALDSLKNEYKKTISDSLKVPKVSHMNLKEIVDFIKQLQNDLTKKDSDEYNKLTSDKKEKTPRKKNSSGMVDSKSKDKTTDMQKDISNPESKLNIDFWNLIRQGSSSQDSYKNLLNKYKSNGGEIIEFLTDICHDKKSFTRFTNNFKKIVDLDKQSLNSLNDLKYKLNEKN